MPYSTYRRMLLMDPAMVSPSMRIEYLLPFTRLAIKLLLDLHGSLSMGFRTAQFATRQFHSLSSGKAANHPCPPPFKVFPVSFVV